MSRTDVDLTRVVDVPRVLALSSRRKMSVRTYKGEHSLAQFRKVECHGMHCRERSTTTTSTRPTSTTDPPIAVVDTSDLHFRRCRLTCVRPLGHTGSQSGSQPLWTPMDLEAFDSGLCGRLWTRLGDLRIRRLGIRVPPGVPTIPLARKGFRLLADEFDDVWSAVGPRELGYAPRRGRPPVPPYRAGSGGLSGPSSPRSMSGRGAPGSPRDAPLGL